jgi:hypothetical protein
MPVAAGFALSSCHVIPSAEEWHCRPWGPDLKMATPRPWGITVKALSAGCAECWAVSICLFSRGTACGLPTWLSR